MNPKKEPNLLFSEISVAFLVGFRIQDVPIKRCCGQAMDFCPGQNSSSYWKIQNSDSFWISWKSQQGMLVLKYMAGNNPFVPLHLFAKINWS